MSQPIPGSFTNSVTIGSDTVNVFSHTNHGINNHSPSNDVALNSNSLNGYIHTSNVPWLRVVYWDGSVHGTPGAQPSPGMEWAEGDSSISKLPYNPHNPGSGIASLVDGGLAIGIAYDFGFAASLTPYLGYNSSEHIPGPPGPVADNHAGSGDFSVTMQGHRHCGLTHFNAGTGRLEGYGSLVTDRYNTPSEWGSNGAGFGTPFDPTLHPFYPQISALAYIAGQLHPSGTDPNITVDNYSRYPNRITGLWNTLFQ